MRSLNFLVLLTLLFVSDYAFAQIPSCPCDTIELQDGTTGNDIIDLLCPGGELGENTDFEFGTEGVVVFSGIPPFGNFMFYQVVQIPDVGQGCGFFQDGDDAGIEISLEEFESCRLSLIRRCDLRIINPIPTLSEWGMIAAVTGLGLIGLFFVTRRKKAAA